MFKRSFPFLRKKPKDIFWFSRHDRYGFLSNYFRAPIEIDSEVWPTSEHYYQAMKTNDPVERERIKQIKKPGDAKLAGYHLTVRPDWGEIRENYMLCALRAKFSQHSGLKKKLLQTGSAHLHEDSPWDEYWGYADGRGRDRLGFLLMKVRSELRELP